MITPHFILSLGFAIVLGAFAIFLLVYGTYVAIAETDVGFGLGMFICFLSFLLVSVFLFLNAYDEYQNAKPQSQAQILKQKISDAEKEYQKYLIDHPELKEAEE